MAGPRDESSDGMSGASNQWRGVDVMSPYYIHASDSPGHIYVGELLDDRNYGEWVNDMSNALFAKNKIGFVDKTIDKPAANSPDLGNWMRCDAMVKGWLKSAMDKEVRSSVCYAKTAREIWADLEEIFGKESAPRAYELRHAIALLRQEKLSVSSYYTKLKSLWDEIQSISAWPKCTCNGCTCDVQKRLIEMRERDQLYDFLMGLDDAYGIVKTQILTAKPTPSLGNAYHLVAEDEQQRSISTTHKTASEVAAFQTQGTRKNGGEPKAEKRDKLRCEHCHKLGHTEEECFEIIGYPPGWNKGKRDKKPGSWTDKRPGPKATQVSPDNSPIPGLTQAQYDRLIQYLGREGETPKPTEQNAPTVNMAGLTFEEPDWSR